MLEDFYDPVTGSLVVLAETRGKDSYREEPFRQGFLDTVDERHEVLRRLDMLDERKRVGISRMHVYRLHGQAIQEIVDMGKEEDQDGHEDPNVPGAY